MTAPLTIGQRIVTAGLYSKITREEYDALDLVNYSRLKLMECPQKFRHACENPGAEDNAAFRLGRVVHLAILEPDRFSSEVVKWTGKVRNGGKWDDFRAANAGKEIVTVDEYKAAEGMRDAVFANKRARELLTGGTAETTVLARMHGFTCKVRIDYLSLAIVDAKSAGTVEPDGFGRAANNYDYPAQGAFYSDVLRCATGERKPFYDVAVEKTPPHVIGVYRFPEEVLAYGRKTYRGWMGRLATCLSTDKWPGYFEGERDLILPRYAMREADHADAA